MKTAIELLKLKRIDLVANVESQTGNANYYANEAPSLGVKSRGNKETRKTTSNRNKRVA